MSFFMDTGKRKQPAALEAQHGMFRGVFVIEMGGYLRYDISKKVFLGIIWYPKYRMFG
jgi:hypothetical protein